MNIVLGYMLFASGVLVGLLISKVLIDKVINNVKKEIEKLCQNK